MLSPLLYTLITHDCVATHDSNTIIKFADDTTVVGLITNNDETAFKEEVRDLAGRCQENNSLSLSISKTKGAVRGLQETEGRECPALDGVVAEPLHFRRLKIFDMGPQILKKFYNCTIESILTGCITTSYGNCLASYRKALQREMRTARYITGPKLPAI